MRKPKRKESSIQKAVVQFARDHGAVAIKLSASLGVTAGWPDYLFLYDGEAELMEFKAEGGKLTDLQKARHAQLDDVKFAPSVVDSVAKGKAILCDRFGWGNDE